jgi:hypothetical protein
MGAPRTIGPSLVLAALALIAGCSSSAVPDRDGGVERDATLAEGGLRVDARDVSDASAVRSDASAVLHCDTSSCDPRDTSVCCVLADRIPECAESGELEEGEPCSGEDECASGLACFRDPVASGGVCAVVCCPGDDAACPDPDPVDGGASRRRCSADGVLISGIETSWGRCDWRRSCDPLAEGSCPEREGCYVRWPRDREEDAASCELAGSAIVGQLCEVQRDCAPGLFCAGVGTRSCVRICRIGDPGSCPDEEGSCVAQAYSPSGTGVCVRGTGL